jgi:hypothetical protein
MLFTPRRSTVEAGGSAAVKAFVRLIALIIVVEAEVGLK